MERRIHEGRNVKRFREMLGIKQEALAYELGDDWNQKKISVLEQKETIDLAILKDVAAALKLPVEAFQNFDEEQAINIISNTVNNNDNANGNSLFSYYPTINPVEKWLEAIEENKRLYERWLKEKEDTIRMLEAIIENTKR
jgi:transcriptional regulator with XRE-family HTH domain